MSFALPGEPSRPSRRVSPAAEPVVPPPAALAMVADKMFSRQYAADFTTSWVCFAVSLVFSHPMDTLRIRRQTHNQSVLLSLKQDGPASLYRGFLTPLAANGPAISTVFALNELFRAVLCARAGIPQPPTAEQQPENLHPNTGAAVDRRSNPTSKSEHAALPFWILLLSGGLAGGAATLYSCPTDTLRIQQQVAGRAGHRNAGGPQSFSAIAREIARSDRGLLRGLYRGWSLAAVTAAGGRMTSFTAYERLKGSALWRRAATLDGRLPDSVARITAAIAAAWLGWIVIYPVDVVKSRVLGDGWRPAISHLSHVALPSSHSLEQCSRYDTRFATPHWAPPMHASHHHCHHSPTAAIAAPPQRYYGVFDAFRQTFREGGLAAFSRGLPLTLGRAAFASGITLPLFDYLKPQVRIAFAAN